MTPEQREAKRVYHAAYSAAWREEHPEEARAHHAAYYAAHRDELRARQAAYNADHREASAAYYQAHKEEKLANRAAHREEKRERDSVQQRWFTGNLRILRAAQGCDDCGVHEGRLAHHHVDPATKKYQTSEMYSYSLGAFMDEVAKCAVLCPSCHQKRHVELRRTEGVLA